MKKLTATFVLLGALALSFPAIGFADTSLPACATNGDKDGDGVLDSADQTDTDSCTLTDTGFEDCSTGAGDGLPDCNDGSQ
jgi:hypothetical protein